MSDYPIILRQLRAKLGSDGRPLPQSDLARLLDPTGRCTDRTISRWENGESTPSRYYRKQIENLVKKHLIN